MDYITKAETLFFARFPEDGDEEPTEADLHEFIGVWLEEASMAVFIVLPEKSEAAPLDATPCPP